MSHYYISFFSWVNEPEQKGGSDEIYHNIANIIKEDLWLNPLNYFNNEDYDEDEDESCDVEKDDDNDDQDHDDEEEE
ncbi:NAP1-related protein 2 [Trifolium medium]|uniref:NAP1-related protein 2 n=1 Tax=Trifolium medium TaxID=97028 RepID=A0A392QL97_9FABA|nr:NAP1-related protein 2 [Trifolium medium]